MPTYQYACTECVHEFEQVQSFSENTLSVCPVCEGRLRKLFNAVGVVFKGSGFYRNDSRATTSGSETAASTNGSSDSSSKESPSKESSSKESSPRESSSSKESASPGSAKESSAKTSPKKASSDS